MLDEQREGEGAPLVFLHGDDGLLFTSEFLGALGAQFEVRAPTHPGWGASECPPHLLTVEDLSYVYLHYLEATLERPAPVVASSFGAWLAAAIATKNTARISSLVLVCPLGIKISDRETRDFVDTYVVSRQEAERAYYGDGPRPDLLALGPDDFEYMARAEEAMARFGFRPYLHDRALVHRLHRIDVPTLIVWGTEDVFVQDPSAYASAFAAAIGPNARTLALPGGHRLEEQHPQELVDAIVEHVGSVATVPVGARS